MRKSEDEHSTYESRLWANFTQAWRPLFGKFDSLGFSFEWHEFENKRALDWEKSFHPQSLEICLNLEGSGSIEINGNKLSLKERTFGFYVVDTIQSENRSQESRPPIKATRPGFQKHRFLTIELSFDFLKTHLDGHKKDLNPVVNEIIEGRKLTSFVSKCERLATRHQKLLDTLKSPPVYAAAQELWYKSKALEVMSEFLFMAPDESRTLFCIRQQKIAQERVEKVKILLEENLAEPPTLEQLGKSVGCSHYYLSRTFSKEVGMTISQYLRQIRIEKAANLLKTGKFNVTEAALEVGYNSLSHFSHAFQKQIGCCPGLYPMNSPGQNNSKDRS